jgi:hypothetical protein
VTVRRVVAARTAGGAWRTSWCHAASRLALAVEVGNNARVTLGQLDGVPDRSGTRMARKRGKTG